MYKLNDSLAREILNLNPGEVIDKEIAERQFKVIQKGFNYLSSSDNKFLYIADEVGLGKTYIALGIASLLRYFAKDQELQNYKDVVIVPKKNLQYKWQKEIKNFTKNNFLQNQNRVKNILGDTVGKITDSELHNQLELFGNGYPSYEIFRNSSFSLGFAGDGWKDKLLSRLDDYGKEAMRIAFKHFRVNDRYTSKDNYPEIKRLFGYLMNIALDKIDLLTVDEAHNFKHGIGKDVAARNQVASRMMGVIDEETDQELFILIPNLRSQIKPLAKKVIFLSATPLDEGCHEIKRMLDIFITDHPYRKLDNEAAHEKIKIELSSFMIRGLMKISLGETGGPIQQHSRNQYRYEHREGNVNKDELAEIQKIDDPFMSATLGLMQFKTAEILNTKNHGGAFEMGMNASFETFSISTDKETDVDEANNRSSAKGVDEDIIGNIVRSYQETFKEELPHPKQDRLITTIFNKMINQEKSLIFVRRVASVNEITRKLVHQYEEWMYSKIENLIPKSKEVLVMLSEYKTRGDRSRFFQYLEKIADRIWAYHKHDISDLVEIADEEDTPVYKIFQKLESIFHLHLDREDVQQLKANISAKMHLTQVPNHIRESTIDILVTYKNTIEDDLEYTETAADFRYFFLDYFTNAYKRGLTYKNLISRQDWYRFNYFYILEQLGLGIKPDQLTIEKKYDTKTERQSYQIDDKNQLLLDNKSATGSLDNVHHSYKKETFFTVLVKSSFPSEWKEWLENRNTDEVFDDVVSLSKLWRGVFRNGSGLTPSFIARFESPNSFEESFVELLTEHFPEVIIELRTILIDFDKIMTTNFPDKNKIDRALYQQAPVLPSSGHHKRGVSGIALQFRMPGFPYVVVSTDVLKEGEDLHSYCSDVYHYGIAWNPSDMEQRTGRIDRINSKTFFSLKRNKKIDFNSSLQVFYPYLADTLEVNQVAKLFRKMNHFVDTFYDVTTLVEKDSKASINELVQHIPLQNKNLLKSKFDYEQFDGKKELGVDLNKPSHVGQLKEVLLHLLISIHTALSQHSDLKHLRHPELIAKNNLLRGVLAVKNKPNERRGPYSIQFAAAKNLGEFEIIISSAICSIHEIRSSSKREKINDELKKEGMKLIIKNDQLHASITHAWDSDIQSIIKSLVHIVTIADDTELRYTGKDEE